MISIIVPTTVQYASSALLSQILNDMDTAAPTSHNLRVAWAVNNILGKCLNGGARVSNMAQQAKFGELGLGVSFTRSLEEATKWVQEGRSVIGRSAYHTKAKDVVLHTSKKWIERDYWVEMVDIPFDEWRIHVCMGKTIARGLKVNTGPQVLKFAARNRRNGWTLSHAEEPPKGIRDVAKRAVAALGYDFAACDIIHKVVDGKSEFYVLEANRAPGMDNYTATAYAKAFRAIANHEVEGAEEKTV